MPQSDEQDGFTLPATEVEAAFGRGVARALGLPGAATPTPLDTEIARVRAAVERRRRELDQMREVAAGACCPSCFHGASFTSVAEQQERTLGWLRILLGKRGGPGDTELAEAIRVSAWP